MLDDGARFHVVSHFIRETVNVGKSMLASSIVGRDDSMDLNSNLKETGSIQNIIQKDRVQAAVCYKIPIVFDFQINLCVMLFLSRLINIIIQLFLYSHLLCYINFL